MSPLFGKKKPDEKTYLVLDIENGSVGSALLRVSKNVQPKLFGEIRIPLPLFDTHHSELLTQEIEKAVRESLVQTSAVAGRLRNAPGDSVRLGELHKVGEIEQVAVFLGAPWGTPNLSKGSPNFTVGMQQFLARELGSFVSETPLTYYTAAGAATHGYSLLYPDQDAIVCIIGGEIIELLLLHAGTVAGYATLPQGYRTFLRTLKSHGSLSSAEAYSTLKLGDGEYEPLRAAAHNLGSEFANIAQHFVVEKPVHNIFVVAQESTGAWVARALSADPSLGALFPEGGGVRALKIKNLAPHMMAHSSASHHALMLEALYLDALGI